MTAVYLDASAFVKLVVAEPESLALGRFLGGTSSRRMSSALLRTESVRAVRELGPSALRRVRTQLRRVELIRVDDPVLDAAGELDPRILRTLDAIHLATAISLGDDLETIVTYDRRMLEGARSIGLLAVAPA